MLRCHILAQTMWQPFVRTAERNRQVKSRTPKMLPWLARKAGISEARAEKLWEDAIRHATARNGRVDDADYWRVAVEYWLELMRTEGESRAVGQTVTVFLQAGMTVLPFLALPFFSVSTSTHPNAAEDCLPAAG